MQLQTLERRPEDYVRPPPKRWADMDEKERAERDSRQAEFLKQRKAKRQQLPTPFVWAPSPPPERAAAISALKRAKAGDKCVSAL